MDLASRTEQLDLWDATFEVLDRVEQVSGALEPHPSFWRWVSFDPPMADASDVEVLPRRVLCRVCDRELGITADPLDALSIARLHRRQLRLSG